MLDLEKVIRESGVSEDDLTSFVLTDVLALDVEMVAMAMGGDVSPRVVADRSEQTLKRVRRHLPGVGRQDLLSFFIHSGRLADHVLEMAPGSEVLGLLAELEEVFGRTRDVLVVKRAEPDGGTQWRFNGAYAGPAGTAFVDAGGALLSMDWIDPRRLVECDLELTGGAEPEDVVEDAQRTERVRSWLGSSVVDAALPGSERVSLSGEGSRARRCAGMFARARDCISLLQLHEPLELIDEWELAGLLEIDCVLNAVRGRLPHPVQLEHAGRARDALARLDYASLRWGNLPPGAVGAVLESRTIVDRLLADAAEPLEPQPVLDALVDGLARDLRREIDEETARNNADLQLAELEAAYLGQSPGSRSADPATLAARLGWFYEAAAEEFDPLSNRGEQCCGESAIWWWRAAEEWMGSHSDNNRGALCLERVVSVAMHGVRPDLDRRAERRLELTDRTWARALPSPSVEPFSLLALSLLSAMT